MRVLAVDPGPHTGVALFTDPPEAHTAWEWTPAQVYTNIETWIASVDVVVCEGFVISGARAREANVTVEMIGVLRYLTIRAGKKFVEQRPGAYKFAGSEKLKRLGWYTPGSDHARSASGHLVLYLAESGLIDAARLIPQTGE